MVIGAGSRPQMGEIVCGDQRLVIQNHVTILAEHGKDHDDATCLVIRYG